MRRSIGVEWERVARWAASRRVSWPLLLAGFAAGGCAWLWNHHGIPWRLGSGDAYEYAEMARRLARGEGFTTGVIYPAELWLGAGAQHPAVKFPPAWPLVLAGPFAVFGATDAVAHAVVGVLFAALVATSAALATRLAGRGAGAIAALAVATSPQLLLLSLDAVSETFFALTLVACFLLCARRELPALGLGLCCALAYLARYNGAVLLPVLFALLWLRGGGVRGVAVCAIGFAALALPWWLRNLVVAGDPLYSLLNLNLHVAPLMTRVGGSLFFQLEPDPTSGVAMDPLAKAAQQLPLLLVKLPYASANLAALAGVALACWRREALSLGFAFCAAATLGVVAFALAMGRYFVPLLPLLLALGSVGWMRYGGRLRAPALALLLLSPWLPSLPAPLPDLQVLGRQAQLMREGRELPPLPDPAVKACLGAHDDLVLAQDAARVVWQYDVVAIYAPVQPRVVAQILDAYPVERVELVDPRRAPPGRLVPAPDCGADWYVPR